jgi:hypothetical protein
MERSLKVLKTRSRAQVYGINVVPLICLDCPAANLLNEGLPHQRDSTPLPCFTFEC